MTGDIIDIIPLYPHQPLTSYHTHYRIDPKPSQFWIDLEVLKANKLWTSLEPEDLPRIAAQPMPSLDHPGEIGKVILSLAAQTWLRINYLD